ncbi:hypothetical protein ACYF6T_07265 [Streptomyces sp. 7R007]
MSRPGPGRVLAAVIGLVAALCLGAVGQAGAASPAGAAVTADRPRLSDDEARDLTVADYLKGNDDWAPHGRH